VSDHTKPLSRPGGDAGSFESEPVPLPDAVGVTVPQNWDGMTDNAKIAEAARLTADNHNRRIVYVKKQCVSQGMELYKSTVIVVRTADEIVSLMGGIQAATCEPTRSMCVRDLACGHECHSLCAIA